MAYNPKKVEQQLEYAVELHKAKKYFEAFKILQKYESTGHLQPAHHFLLGCHLPSRVLQNLCSALPHSPSTRRNPAPKPIVTPRAQGVRDEWGEGSWRGTGGFGSILQGEARTIGVTKWWGKGPLK